MGRKEYDKEKGPGLEGMEYSRGVGPRIEGMEYKEE